MQKKEEKEEKQGEENVFFFIIIIFFYKNMQSKIKLPKQSCTGEEKSAGVGEIKADRQEQSPTDTENQ